MKKSTIFFALLFACLLIACSGQRADSGLIKKFKRPDFVASSPALQKQLRIPYLEGNLYGLCDYEGKMLLKPQFEDIEMPVYDLGFVKGKKNGEWSLYDFSGRQMLPFSVKNAHLLDVELEYKAFEGNNYHYMAKVREPGMALLKALPSENAGDNSGGGIEATVKSESAQRFFYLSKNAKSPLQGWFVPNERVYSKFSQKTGYYNQAFTNSVFHGFWKVMDENWRLTLLDDKMKPLFSPVFNCAAISPTKILILKENGLCALRDLKKGWQTDFMFRNVSVTENPDMCLGEAKIGDKIVEYKIDANGKVTQLEDQNSWLALNERYSCIGEKSGEYKTDFYLFDEKMGKKLRKLPHRRLEKIFEKGFGIYKGQDLIGIETYEGDTIWRPPFQRIHAIGDSLYTFYSEDSSGLFSRDNRLIYSVLKGEVSHLCDGSFQVKKDNKLGLIAANGRQVLPVAFDNILPIRSAKLLIATQNGLSGLYDWEIGREILPPVFKHLQPNPFPAERRGCVEVRVGKDFFILNRNLGVLHQNAENPILTKKDFQLTEAAEAVKADFEKSEMPRFFSPFCVFKGPNWIHIFRCDGVYVTSLEGFKEFEMEFIGSTVSDEELGSAWFSGVALLTTSAGKKVWVRLEDGFLYEK